MTNPRPGSKADYKKRLNASGKENGRLTRAADKLEHLGYEEVTKIDPLFGHEDHSWELTEAAKEARAANERELEDAHKVAARTETLATVIEALEITGYANGGYIGDLFTAINGRNGHDARTSYDTDRFWADLTTALDVREDRKRAELRAATEERVRTIGGVHVTIDGSALATSFLYGDKPAAPAAPTTKTKKPKGAKRTERGYN